MRKDIEIAIGITLGITMVNFMLLLILIAERKPR